MKCTQPQCLTYIQRPAEAYTECRREDIGLSLKGLKPVEESAAQKPSTHRSFPEGLIYRCMPAVGADHKGASEAEYAIFVSYKENHVIT